MKIKIESRFTAGKKLSQFLKKFGGENQISPSILSELDLALGELLNNILSYGYIESESVFIEITCEKVGSNIKGLLKDTGFPFNPLDFKIQDSSSMSLQERQIGGLGLSIADNLLIFTNYERKEGQNLLEFKKEIKT